MHEYTLHKNVQYCPTSLLGDCEVSGENSMQEFKMQIIYVFFKNICLRWQLSEDED